MPVGFCCENCILYDEYSTCLKSKTGNQTNNDADKDKLVSIKLIDASIEAGLLKVVIKHEGNKEKTLLIDLKTYLEAS